MSYFIYSHEALPNESLMGKPGYTPEFIRVSGVQLDPLAAKAWTKLPDTWRNVVHKDWKDRSGTVERTMVQDIIKAITDRFTSRGVVVLDHEPSDNERKVYAAKSEQANLAFRMTQIEHYESQVREKEVTGHGRTQPTPYENQCYEILGITKPYSVEAMRAQRHPGEAVGEQIVAALERLDARRREVSHATEKAAPHKPTASA